jgi:hypothetical protein
MKKVLITIIVKDDTDIEKIRKIVKQNIGFYLEEGESVSITCEDIKEG